MEALSLLMVAGWDVRNNKGKSMPSEMPFSSAETLNRYLLDHSFRLAFDGHTFEKWQNQLTSSLKEYLGPFPEQPVPLNSRVVSTEKFEKFTLYKVIYDSRPDLSVPAYLLIPHRLKEKSPAVLCIHGHVPEGKANLVFGDGQQVQDHIYIDDVVNATIKSLEDQYVNVCYNIGSNDRCSINDLIKKMIRYYLLFDR